MLRGDQRLECRGTHGAGLQDQLHVRHGHRIIHRAAHLRLSQQRQVSIDQRVDDVVVDDLCNARRFCRIDTGKRGTDARGQNERG